MSLFNGRSTDPRPGIEDRHPALPKQRSERIIALSKPYATPTYVSKQMIKKAAKGGHERRSSKGEPSQLNVNVKMKMKCVQLRSARAPDASRPSITKEDLNDIPSQKVGSERRSRAHCHRQLFTSTNNKDKSMHFTLAKSTLAMQTMDAEVPNELSYYKAKVAELTQTIQMKNAEIRNLKATLAQAIQSCPHCTQVPHHEHSASAFAYRPRSPVAKTLKQEIGIDKRPRSSFKLRRCKELVLALPSSAVVARHRNYNLGWKLFNRDVPECDTATLTTANSATVYSSVPDIQQQDPLEAIHTLTFAKRRIRYTQQAYSPHKPVHTATEKGQAHSLADSLAAIKCGTQARLESAQQIIQQLTATIRALRLQLPQKPS